MCYTCFTFQQPANDGNGNNSWMQKQFSRLTSNLRYRISGEGHSKPPDWFLDKFAAQTFSDPEEPLYQAKSSKLFCGLKLAFDPTLPAHYHVSNKESFWQHLSWTVFFFVKYSFYRPLDSDTQKYLC